MEHARFDRLAAALGSAASRRAGVKAALALLAAGASGAGALWADGADGGAAAGGKRRDGNRSPKPEGPCGDGSRKDNICTKDSQCCTGFCNTSLGGKNIDGKGRCRCINPGKKCKPNQTCCGGATCLNKKCRSRATCGAVGAACSSDASCCSGLSCEGRGNGTCTVPASCGAVGAPCAASDACCSGLACQGGSCAPCAASVCATCQYTTVEAAYAAAAAGSTIYIGPGVYTTLIEASKDMTLEACPGVTGVILRPDPSKTSLNGNVSIVGEDPGDTSSKRTITLRNLTLEGTGIAAAEVLLDSGANGTVNFTVDGCTVKDAFGVINGLVGEFVVEDTAMSGCSYGLNLNGAGAVNMTVRNSQFTNFGTGKATLYVNPDYS